MKSADADLIDRLNALPEAERKALLEFLGAGGAGAEAPDAHTRDRLEASAWLHHNTTRSKPN